MSDHADWPGLQKAIAGTGAERIFVTHGSVAILVRWLQENGLEAQGFRTEYGDDDVADRASPPADAGPEEEPVASGGDAVDPPPDLPPEGGGAMP
jgi:putative mRNA 3-end processing factor